MEKRLSAPKKDNKYYIHTSKGGLNSCILIEGNSVLPNCVGYAWGRFYEISGIKPKLARTNAETLWIEKDGYERGQTPKLGSVICWSKGQVDYKGKDGAGHVAIVEQIKEDGTIVTSQSAYGGSKFYTKEFKKPYSLPGYNLQGFIYNPEIKDEPKIEPKPTKKETIKEIKPKIKKGDKVKLKKGALVWGETYKFSAFVYLKTLYVREDPVGNRVVISTRKTGAITGATHINNLIKK